MKPLELVLVRHGETTWSRDGRHTGRTDIPLTAAGRRQARLLGARLRCRRFSLVLTSPLQRAAETCRLAGFGDVVRLQDELMEWDYGAYEGRTTPDIRTDVQGWSLWKDGAPGGETAEDVARRVDRLLSELRGAAGDIALFAHGHVLRVLAARWLGLGPAQGKLLTLDPATISVLGYEREVAVIVRWNCPLDASGT